jgi:Ca-activated chloride channel family protein
VSFAHPEWLWLLVIVPMLAAWAVRAQGRRVRDWAALGQGGQPGGDSGWGWLAAVACLIVALAQPRWGRDVGEALPPGHDVVLLVDVSRSMGAEDAVPSRLGVAVEAAESLVAALGREPGDRAAVVAFAGRGVVRCPLTENLGAVVEALRALRPGAVRPGGTDLAAGLAAALEAFDDQEHAEGRAVVLFSDGEDLAGAWGGILPRLRESGLIVHAVAIGDPGRGHPVPSGDGGPLLYRGEPVMSRRSDLSLAAVARQTGGALLPLGLKTADLGSLYQTRIVPVARRRRQALRPPERVERFGAFVLAALALGLAGSWPARRPQPRRALPWLAAAVIVLSCGAGQGGETTAEAIARGNALYVQGDFTAALAGFERAIALAPREAVPRYDAAAALFQLRRYAEAAARYREARDRADAGLRAKIDYALGNTSVALGEVSEALRQYDACLASRVPGPAFEAVRRDAAINRRFAAQLARDRPDGPKEGRGRPRADRGPSAATKSDGERSPSASGSVAPAPAGVPPDALRPGVRRNGGAGGTRPSPPGGTPESRLAAALEHVRDARRLRLPDVPPPASSDERKDW